MGTDVREQVWAKTQGRCWYCGKQTTPWGDFSVDHMDPQKQGGGDAIENLVPACRSCNSMKHAKTVEEFRAYLLEKKRQVFWGEHHGNGLPHTYPSSIEDDAPNYEKYYSLFLSINFYAVHTHHCLSSVLFALTNVLEDGHAKDLSTFSGQIIFPELEAATHFSATTLLSLLFLLEDDGVLSLTQYKEERYHTYIVHTASLDFVDRAFLKTLTMG